MNLDETDLVERLHAVAEAFEMPPTARADDLRRGRRRVRRHQGLVAGVAAAAVALLVGVIAVVGGSDRGRSPDPAPVDTPTFVTPKVVADAVPVWYDAAGLHHGDVVEQTPVEILQPEQPGPKPNTVYPAQGALALVSRGALYNDPKTGDVWYHPWGGTPEIVGHDSDAGPSGDPQGDIAVWFEGSNAMNAGAGELVVYDTAAGREISRTSEGRGVFHASGDHYPPGNTFLDVSAEHIVWSAAGTTYSHDLSTQTTTVVNTQQGWLIDVHDDVQVLGGSLEDLPVVVRRPGKDDSLQPDLEPHLKLSTTGNYVLAVEATDERHAAAIVDTMTGELWRVPRNAYPWIAWSYGDLALVDADADGDDQAHDVLLACDAPRRKCEVLDAERPFLMPTN